MTETRYLTRSMLMKMLQTMSEFNHMQHDAMFQPYTCGNDSTHEALYPVFEGGQIVLLCRDCDYRQEIPNE